jgi:glutamate synthase (NADPH/NADH) small chain
MREQDPKVRCHNFHEVNLGYSKEEAMIEASRCLNCKDPQCVQGCPVNVNIPEFIAHLKEGNFKESYTALSNSLLFPCITGRVCPQETQCEGACILNKSKKVEPISIGNLERFVGDWARKNKVLTPHEIKENGKRVAVIGSGPSGMTVAADLRKLGYSITLYEALHRAGGVLTYGIPEFRLPKRIVQYEVQKLVDMGVQIRYNTLIGATKPFADLKSDYDAIFIGAGAGLPRFMGVPGEDLVGVYSANEFLVRINLMGADKFPNFDTPIEMGDTVVVIGGGNVAMDSARVALRLGGHSHIFYRRGVDNMPARAVEIHHAREEGVVFNELCAPRELIGENGKLKSMIYEINELSEELDSSGRQIPVCTDKTASFDCESLIIAVGQGPNPVITRKTPNIDKDRRGYITINPETLHVTSVKDCLVFAGGDIIGDQHKGRGGTVIDAMGHGRLAAKYIDIMLRSTTPYQTIIN